MVRYYEVEFTDGYGMCIKSEIEDPTREQVGAFLVANGDGYTEEDISLILEIDHEDAVNFYDMGNEANFPVLKN